MLRQLGLVAVNVVGAAVALATVRPWGRVVPHWLLLSACWATCGLIGAGSVGFLLRAFGLAGDGPATATSFVVVAFLVAWTGVWAATAVSYQRRRKPHRHGDPDRLL